MKRTALYGYHLANSKLIDFAGFEMPIWYSSITEEHLAVRNHAGIFDVSHMGRIIVKGNGSDSFIDYLIPTEASAQPAGKSFYTLLLNEDCGIVDDLIIIKRHDKGYLLVVNAANIEKDLTHIRKYSGEFEVEIEDISYSSSMIAIQGPEASQTLQPLITTNLEEVDRFRNIDTKVEQTISSTITRTGYTGEDGFEMVLYDSGPDNGNALKVWGDLAKIARPCGLGARDSLRMEAGLALYGSDIDENTNPVEADLSWVVAKKKQGYVGFENLQRLLSNPPERVRRGIVLHEKVPRRGFQLFNDQKQPIGMLTSGTFSPTIRHGIGLGYTAYEYSRVNQPLKVLVRESYIDANVSKLPFYDETLYGWKRLKKTT